MADRLSRIIGTEEDKVNCAFYFKIGACRHGDRCSRNHLRPQFSQTLLIPHMYLAPPAGPDGQPTQDEAEYFEDFYEEVVEEFASFGGIEELNVVENLGDHMFGNVYVKFKEEESAHKCLTALTGRYYAGRVLMPEYSPVTDFREARCRQHEETHCGRGGYCNFMHLKKVPRAMRKLLRKSRKKRSRSRSRSRGRSGSRGRKRMSSRSREREEFKRASSAERRAIFRQWNREREKEKKAEAEAAAKASDIDPALVAQTLAAATGQQ